MCVGSGRIPSHTKPTNKKGFHDMETFFYTKQINGCNCASECVPDHNHQFLDNVVLIALINLSKFGKAASIRVGENANGVSVWVTRITGASK